MACAAAAPLLFLFLVHLPTSSSSPPQRAPVAVAASFDASVPANARPLTTTYLSFNVDSGSLFNNFDFVDPVFTQLVANLARAAPTQVRVGGGAADNVFNTGAGGARGNCSVPSVDPSIDICVDDAYVSEICAFAGRASVGLVLDLNVAIRRWVPATSKWVWNASNAINLLAFIAQLEPACPIAAWQLGNEVEDFYKRRPFPGAPTANISGADLAADFRTLRTLLSQPRFAALAQQVYGPDACCEDRLAPPIGSWLSDFARGTVGAVDAVTVHMYPIPRLANNSCVPSLFANKSQMAASVALALEQYTSWASPLLRTGASLIVGEIATSAHGGCDGLSNRFVAGFAFIYELSAIAELGAAQLNRQDLAGFSSETEPSNYGLLGPPGWARGAIGQPHPDYFVALLFKQLAGRAVLSSSFTSPSANASGTWDSHVWCLKGTPGGVLLSYFNMGGDDVILSLPQLGASVVPRAEYLLTSAAAPSQGDAWPPSLTDDVIYLNGGLMAVNADGTLPAWPIAGRAVEDPAAPIALSPWSFGFVAFPSAGAAACA